MGTTFNPLDITHLVPPGTRPVKTPYTLRTGEFHVGAGGTKSILKAHASLPSGRGIVESYNYDAAKAGDMTWDYEGGTNVPVLSNLGIQGLRDITQAELNPLLTAPTETHHGIRYFATSPIIDTVSIVNILGTAMILECGSHNYGSSVNTVNTRSKGHIDRCYINRCLNGIKNYLPETFITGNEISGVRNIGLHLLSTAGHIHNNHIFGGDVATQVGTPEEGNLQYFTKHHSADARIGFLNYGPGTKCDGLLRLYNCTETALETFSTIKAASLYITAVGNTSAVVIHGNCDKTMLSGEIDMADTARGIYFKFDPEGPSNKVILHDLKIDGGQKSMLIEQPLFDHVWSDLYLYDNDLDIRAFGQNNHIRAYGNGTISNNSGTALHVSNKITLNGDVLTL